MKGQPFDRKPLAKSVKPFDETLDQAPVARVQPIPFRSGRRTLEQFDLITAARHGIGKPCDGFFNREASPIRRAINFDTIDGTRFALRSEEHKSELQSLMRISYAVFCL